MDMHGIIDQKRCLEKVLKTFYTATAKNTGEKDETGILA
jgi:hypothetical protein